MRHLRGALAAAFACLLHAPFSDAAPSPCEVSAPSPRLSLGAQRGEEAELGGSGGATARITRSAIDWRGRAGEAGFRFGAGHEYSIYDITPVASAPANAPREPSANGHLHVLHATADLSPLLAGGWELRLQGALAVSSNFLKEPGEIGREAAQLNVGAARNFGTPENGWRLGLCGDHRFGGWRIYPLLSWHWAEDPWTLRLGWPLSRVGRHFGESLETSLELAPAGQRWRVLDERIGDSRFVHEAWRLRWSLDWRPRRRWSLSLEAAALFDGEYAFTLDTGERYEGASGSPLQIGLSLHWHYAE